MVDTRFSLSVHVMMTLAYHKEELVNSEYLAGVLKTNPTFVRKIVSRLVEAKLVDSFRGKGGGIRIAKSPSEIVLSDIYAAAVEDKCLVSTHKRPVMRSCPVSCCMDEVLTDIVDGIEDSTKNYLSKMRLSDLLRKVQKK
jgi:Rrf2 family protein